MNPFILARWSGRTLALVGALFWGLFLVEHLLEWFVHPFPDLPPPKVILLVAMHGLMVVGLLLLWRREIVGSLLALGAALVFFSAAAGPRFPLFFAVTALPPALVLLAAWKLPRRAPSRPSGAR